MNILINGYYDDFSRFFIALKKDLKKKNAKVYFHHSYFSGFLYSFLRLHRSVWISFQAYVFSKFRKDVIQANFKRVSKEYNLQYVIEYHSKLHKKKFDDQLKNLAVAYILILENFLSLKKIELIISSGDSRLFNRVLKSIAEKNRIKILYFEQGPFNTTIIDSKGVNANCSFRYVNSENKLSRNKAKVSQIKYNRCRIYRGLDLILQFLLNALNLYPIDLVEKWKYDKSIILESSKFKTKELKEYILIILQVPYDANMIIHSPLVKSSSHMLECVMNSITTETKIVVREHPLFIGKYEKSLYEFIEKNSNVFIDKTDLKSSIRNSSAIVVNNSTVGVEAIKFKKKILVLGDCYYDNLKEVIKIKNLKDLKVHLNSSGNLNAESNGNYNLSMLCDNLIEGHFRNKDLSFTSLIAKGITDGF